jgi:hypothetical protein
MQYLYRKSTILPLILVCLWSESNGHVGCVECKIKRKFIRSMAGPMSVIRDGVVVLDFWEWVGRGRGGGIRLSKVD